MGRIYERLVRSVKTQLQKFIGKSLVTYEEVQTVLCDVESVINSRPLAYMSEDDIEEALTPFSFDVWTKYVKEKYGSKLKF